VLLLTLPLVSVYYFKEYSGELFEKDKLSYVYDTLGSKNQEKLSILKSLIETVEERISLLELFYFKKGPRSKILESIRKPGNDENITIYQKKNKVIKLIYSELLGEKYKIASKEAASLILPEKGVSYLRGNVLRVVRHIKGPKDELIVIVYKLDLYRYLERGENIYTFTLVSLINKKHPLNKSKLGRDIVKIKKLAKLTSDKSAPNGVTKIEIGDKILLMAYSKLSEDVSLIATINEELVLSTLKEIKYKTLIIFLIIVGLSGIISVLFSKKMTRPLKKLLEATKEINDGNYEIEIANKPSDEIGLLATSFEEMALTIQNLLNDLKEYNQNLEVQVKERTIDLNKSLSLQEAMVDSLSEGFLVFNRDGIIGDIASKACLSIFNKKPHGKSLTEVMSMGAEDKETFTDLCNNLVDESLPFDDMKSFMPQSLNDESRKIDFNYTAIRNHEKKIESVVLIASDNTTEYLALKAATEQEAYVNLVVKVLSNKKEYIDLIQNLKRVIQSVLEIDILDDEVKGDYFRLIHTYKGRASFFSMKPLVDLLHDVEEMFSTKSESSKEDILKHVTLIDDHLSEFCESSREWLGVNPWIEHTKVSIEIPYEVIYNLAYFLKSGADPAQIYTKFIINLAQKSVENYFLDYKALVNDISSRTGVKLENFELSGAKVKVINFKYDDLFNSFIHIYTNIFTHAFTSGEKNIISTTWSMVKIDGFRKLKIEISDNGKGIDVEKIAEAKKLELTDSNRNEILMSIFDDEVSTANEVSSLMGRGIGLSAVKTAVEKMKGTISVQTEKNKGTKFIVSVPYINDFKFTKEEQRCLLEI